MRLDEGWCQTRDEDFRTLAVIVMDEELTFCSVI